MLVFAGWQNLHSPHALSCCAVEFGIAVVGLGEHNAGTFEYRLAAAAAASGAFAAVPSDTSDTKALLLGPDDELRFMASEPETATLQFVAW